MRTFFATAVVLTVTFPLLASAFSVVFNEPERPYDVHTIADVTEPTYYYGTLDGFPDTYEFTLEEPTEFNADIWAYPENDETVRFAGILVRERETGGVRDIARPTSADWEPFTDEVTNIRYLAGPSYTGTLEPGTYRFEVSNPDNIGAYMLRVGGEAGGGEYLSTLATIREVYQYYDRSSFALLFLPQVYLPLGILLLIGLIYLTVRFRQPRHDL